MFPVSFASLIPQLVDVFLSSFQPQNGRSSAQLHKPVVCLFYSSYTPSQVLFWPHQEPLNFYFIFIFDVFRTRGGVFKGLEVTEEDRRMNPQCARCGKIVYPTEKVSCLDKVGNLRPENNTFISKNYHFTQKKYNWGTGLNSGKLSVEVEAVEDALNDPIY